MSALLFLDRPVAAGLRDFYFFGLFVAVSLFSACSRGIFVSRFVVFIPSRGSSRVPCWIRTQNPVGGEGEGEREGRGRGRGRRLLFARYGFAWPLPFQMTPLMG